MAWQIYDGWNGTRDGNWSTFNLRVGNPPRILPAVPSTANSRVHLPFAESPKCVGTIPGASFDCSQHVYDGRTFLYQPCESTTAQNFEDCELFSDIFSDGHAERHELVLNQTLMINGSITGHGLFLSYYTHAASLGIMMRLRRHDVDPSWSKSIYSHGVPGVTRADSFFQSFSQFYLQSSDDRNLSLTYGYTAGAWYRETPASLSIGSIDPTRIGTETRTVPKFFSAFWPRKDKLSDAFNREPLAVHFESINASAVLNVPEGGLRSTYLAFDDQQGFSTYLDPERPFIELPEAACLRIAQDFDLICDKKFGLFTLTPETRARLRKLRPSFTFRLTYNLMAVAPDPAIHVPPIDITLPYEAFEHDFQNGDGSLSPYFPISVAPYTQHGGKIILGRVFFQEVYLAVDYHNRSYNLSTARFPVPPPMNVDENLVWDDRPLTNDTSSGEPISRPTDNWFMKVWKSILRALTWILICIGYPIAIAFIIVSLLIFLHGVLPLILAVPRSIVWIGRRRKLERVWIQRHIGGSVDTREVVRRRKRATRNRIGQSPHSIVVGAAKKAGEVVDAVWSWVSERVSGTRRQNLGDATPILDADLIDLETAYEAEIARRTEEGESARRRREEERERRGRKAEDQRRRREERRSREEEARGERRRNGEEEEPTFGRRMYESFTDGLAWVAASWFGAVDSLPTTRGIARGQQDNDNARVTGLGIAI